MEGTGATVTAAPTISMAARLDQLAAAIYEAHAVMDDIAPETTAEEKMDAPSGAEAQLGRCQDEMQYLITRLAGVRDRVGQL